MMGIYLSHLRNQKADARTGRVPDENYAREVMQLFSIGLVELNEDGTPRTGSGGAALDTYTPADIAGLARVFTGWSWTAPTGPTTAASSTAASAASPDPDRSFKPMLGYPQYHSTEAKSFLGTTIAAQSPGRPDGQPARGARHAGRAPERRPVHRPAADPALVTSNPSPAYVAACRARSPTTAPACAAT
jgi:uncharacterized protein (DUF1800 family)